MSEIKVKMVYKCKERYIQMLKGWGIWHGGIELEKSIILSVLISNKNILI